MDQTLAAIKSGNLGRQARERDAEETESEDDEEATAAITREVAPITRQKLAPMTGGAEAGPSGGKVAPITDEPEAGPSGGKMAPFPRESEVGPSRKKMAAISGEPEAGPSEGEMAPMPRTVFRTYRRVLGVPKADGPASGGQDALSVQSSQLPSTLNPTT